MNEFKSNIDRLLRIRELAQKYLWDDLHGVWLPQLNENSDFIFEFEKNIQRALAHPKFEMFRCLCYTAIAAVAGYLILGPLAPVAGVAAALLAKSESDDFRLRYGNLINFMQTAKDYRMLVNKRE